MGSPSFDSRAVAGGVNVASTISRSVASSNATGRPLRGRSCNASKPPRTNRFRHVLTVVWCTPRSAATPTLFLLSAQARMTPRAVCRCRTPCRQSHARCHLRPSHRFGRWRASVRRALLRPDSRGQARRRSGFRGRPLQPSISFLFRVSFCPRACPPLAGAKLPSRNASVHSMRPRSFRSARNARQMLS
jgi:hypothetical protein